MTYRAQIDGLRGLAILLVLGMHSGLLARPRLVWHGYLGVDVFFVLSGFLITTILVERRPTLGAFFARRARRLMPAVAAMVAVTFAAGYGSGMALAGLAYVANWYGFVCASHGIHGHLWSLSIEEQFYIGWALAVAASRQLARDRKLLGLVAWNAAVLVMLWRGVNAWAAADDTQAVVHVYIRTDMRVDGMLVGAAMALWWPWLGGFRRATKRLAPFALATILVAAFAWPDDGPWHVPWTMLAYGAPVIALLAVVVVSACWDGWGAWGPLVPIGKVSYSLYVWHYPIWRIAAHEGVRAWPLVLAVTVAATLASYFWIEPAFYRRR